VDMLLDLWSDLHAKIPIRGVCFDPAGNLLCVAGISIVPGREENARLDSSDSPPTAPVNWRKIAITLIDQGATRTRSPLST